MNPQTIWILTLPNTSKSTLKGARQQFLWLPTTDIFLTGFAIRLLNSKMALCTPITATTPIFWRRESRELRIITPKQTGLKIFLKENLNGCAGCHRQEPQRQSTE